MRTALMLMLGAAVTVLAACGSSPPQARGSGPQAVSHQLNAPSRSRWSPYLVVMTDKERAEFLDIEEDAERETWLRRTGIDVRADLSQQLSRGLSEEAARRRVGGTPDEAMRDGRSATLFYSRYNTQSMTYFWMKFENDQLLSWNSYTREQQDRERELLAFEQRLLRKFDTVLERGMGMNAINRQAAAARNDLNQVELAHRERTSDADYREGRSVSSRDYIIAEQLLYARTRNELFEWFQGRQPDRIFQQDPFERHLYNMVHTDTRGKETTVTAEFVFESGTLKDWFVYHER